MCRTILQVSFIEELRKFGQEGSFFKEKVLIEEIERNIERKMATMEDKKLKLCCLRQSISWTYFSSVEALC